MSFRTLRILCLFFLTVFVFASCDQAKTTEGTTTQTGTLQGRVTDATPAKTAPSRQAAGEASLPLGEPGKGLSEVRVTVFFKGQLKTVKTNPDTPKTAIDESGYFTMPGLPAGVLLPVTFERQGYVTLTGNVEIPAVAGSGDSAIPLKDPVASIEVGMVQGSGTASLNLDRLIKFKGLLQGIVVDGTPGSERGTPLGDVTINLFVAGTLVTAKSKTDDEKTPSFKETGYFSIPNLPPGQPISATFEKSGYQTTRITVTIPVTEGVEQPAVNVEIKLVKGESTKIIEDTVKPLPYNGTIQGVIRDGTVAADTFGKPISGVTVAALVLGKVVETTSKEDDPLTPGFDETGFFALNNLPIGIAIPVRFSKSTDYVPVTSSITITDPALSTQGVEQETAQITVDIDLVKSTATLLVVVYSGKGPAEKATVVLDLTNATTASLNNSTGVSFGSGFEVYQVKATDKNGEAKFEGLPPVVIPMNAIVVQPFDESGDTKPDYKSATNGASVDLRMLSSGTGPSVLRFNLLSSSSITPTVLWSNVVSTNVVTNSASVLNKNDVLRFIFDIPMDTVAVAEVKDSSGKVTTEGDPKNASWSVTLTDPDGLPVPFTAKWKDNVTLEVDPINDLQPTNKVNFDPTSTCGANCYTVTVRARSIQGVFMAATYSASFKVTEKSSALSSPSVSAWPPGSPTDPPTQIDWNAVSFTIQWGSDAAAVGYNVYLKDNRANKDWVRGTSTNTFALAQGGTIVQALAAGTGLPTQFDQCQTAGGVCGGIEPLAYGGTLTVAVTSVNRDGIESALDDKKTFTFTDNKPPDIATTAAAGLKVARATAGLSNFCFDTVAATGDTQVLAPATQTGVASGTTADNATVGNCPQGTAASCTAAKILRIRLQGFPEPMAGGGAVSVINTTASATGDCAGGTTSNTADPTVVAGPAWVETTAGQGNRELYVDISIPAQKSAVGDCIKFDFNGITDVTGNAETQIKPDTLPSTAIVDGRCKSQGDVFIYKLY